MLHCKGVGWSSWLLPNHCVTCSLYLVTNFQLNYAPADTDFCIVPSICMCIVHLPTDFILDLLHMSLCWMRVKNWFHFVYVCNKVVCVGSMWSAGEGGAAADNGKHREVVDSDHSHNDYLLSGTHQKTARQRSNTQSTQS